MELKFDGVWEMDFIPFKYELVEMLILKLNSRHVGQASNEFGIFVDSAFFVRSTGANAML